MNPKIRHIINFLNDNLHRQITMAELAAMVGLSRSRVDSLFKSELDQTTVQYLRELRLERARTLLETTTLKIKQIRLAVGYQSHSHFFQDFKKQFGVPPSEYRKRYLTLTLTDGGLTKKIVKLDTKQ